jgi:hypothetical protein
MRSPIRYDFPTARPWNRETIRAAPIFELLTDINAVEF